MLPALLLLTGQRPAYATFAAFVNESGKAILGVSQGEWTMTYKDGPKDLFLVQGNSSKETYEKDGKTQGEYVLTSTFATYVDHDEKTFSQVTYDEWRGGWERERLAPMKTEGIEIRLATDRGLVFRTDPPVGSARVVVDGKKETLVARVRKKDGTTWDLELSRDAKTKLPIEFRLTVGGSTKPRIATFVFERREVLPFELAVEPETYRDYRKVPFRYGG